MLFALVLGAGAQPHLPADAGPGRDRAGALAAAPGLPPMDVFSCSSTPVL